jgi:ABC-2 type transport system permease protein
MNSVQITKKDLLLLARDRRTLFVLVALPLAFIAIIGSSTGQLFNQAQNARKYIIGVVDADQSELSAHLIEAIRSLKAVEIVPHADLPSARLSLAQDQIHILVNIGKRFDELVEEIELFDLLHRAESRGRLQGGLKSLDISVESGSFLANASELVEVIVTLFAIDTITPSVLDRNPNLKLQILKASKQSQSYLDESIGKQPDLPTKEADSSQLTSIIYQTVVPGYTVMFVFFIVTFMARSFIGEHDLGTLARLRLAPITRSGMLIGKTLPFLIISLVQTALLFIAGKVLFGMNWGHQPWLLLPIMLCTSLAATCLGLMVATLVQTESQVSAYGNFLVLIMAGISGCMMPRSWQPVFMQKIGLVTPHAWALIGYDQILNRPEPEMTVVLHCCGAMTGFAAFYFAVGWWRTRRVE